MFEAMLGRGREISGLAIAIFRVAGGEIASGPGSSGPKRIGGIGRNVFAGVCRIGEPGMRDDGELRLSPEDVLGFPGKTGETAEWRQG
jgi:hypothetical protein